jgi:hypothetical protein
MHEHLVAAVEVAVDVVEEREVQQPVPVVGDHCVDGGLFRGDATPGCHGEQGGVEGGLVVGFVAHLEQQVEP